MKKITLLFAFLSCFIGIAQIIEFENLALKAYLLEANPTNQRASTGTATVNNNNIRNFSLYYEFYTNSGSTKLIFQCSNYHPIDTNNDGQIDIDEASVITFLDLDGFNFVSDLTNSSGASDLQYFTNLKYLGLAQTSNLSEEINIDLSQNTDLQMLNLNSAQLNNLDFSQNTALQILVAAKLNDSQNLNYNSNFGDLSNLVFLNINSVGQIDNLDLPGKPLLKDLYYKENGLIAIDVSQNTALTTLDVSNSSDVAVQLVSLDVSQNTALITLRCDKNNLTSLDVSQNLNLSVIDCSGNQLTALDVTQNAVLEFLSCSYNELTALDLTQNSNLDILYCGENELTELNISQNPNLYTLHCFSNQLTELNLSQNPNLNTVRCYFNQLTELNLSQNPNLKILVCSHNNITELDLSQNLELEGLNCTNNPISALDLMQNPNLFSLQCSNNSISELNLTQNTDLGFLNCSFNDLNALDLTQNLNLFSIYCSNNDINALDLTQNSNLVRLFCASNNLETIDISSCPNLNELDARFNQLIDVNVKNNLFNTTRLEGNSDLLYVCADEIEFNDLEDLSLNDDVIINSFCNFNSGDTFYNISGNALIIKNETNCTDSNAVYPFLKFNVSNTAGSGIFYANAVGNYNHEFAEGTYTLTPAFENPDYFNVSPSSITAAFPATESLSEQNFCIMPNGIHYDLEVTIIPLDGAVPGFDASYKILYKNKGNQPVNANLTFTYDDAVLDFLSSSVIPDTEMSGLLSWNLGTLQPLETGFIIVNFNLNTPMETPPSNSGDILNFQALIILGDLMDETPEDNTFVLNQTVVNSYDPNDKTCLEGQSIHPDMIGEFVHYRIRFENLGTFPAQNVVIEDTIDAEKFDIATLQMVDASHDCRTQIIGQKVSFIFDNIQLDFNDETNDGYVVFKIKTLSTLTLNSTISNTAEIYFDFNFPIITNTETSTFEILIPENDISENEFILHPNPAKNMLTITSIRNIEILNIDIYNPQGQLVLTVQNPSNAVDVSNLTTGTYFVKVRTNRGTSNTKFVKE